MKHTSLSRPALETAAAYVVLFAAMGAYVPFWPVWLEDWGLSKAEVGAYSAAAIVIRVVAGLGLPMLADKLDSRRAMLVALCLAGAVFFALHLVVPSRPLLLLGTLATGAVMAGVMPLGEALGTGAARKHGFAYAPARAMGSLSFLAMAWLTGYLIAGAGVNVVIAVIVVSYLAAAALGHRHPGGGTATQARPGFGELLKIIANPSFALFAIGIGCLQASHAVYFAYSSIHWRDLGLSEATIGQLWAFAIAAEIAIMLGPGPWLVARLGPVAAIGIAGVIAAGRWLAMAFDPVGAPLWALQATHAATFGLGHLGAMAFIVAAVPDRANASAQGAYSGLSVGILLALGTMLASIIYPAQAAHTYLLGVVIAVLGVAACVALTKRWRGETLGV